jgi:glycosyltransferase involved in cell wall biosynthesis
VNKNLAQEVFAQVDAIVVPSIWAENSPLVIHEAQACQIPVITANFGGMSEYVQHHQNGLLFEHRNSESLHEQLAYAVNHPDLLARLGKRGYLYSENGQVPSIEAHCASLEEVYARLLTPIKPNHADPAIIQSHP